MSGRTQPNYSLSGEPETRLEREFDEVFKQLEGAQMQKYFTAPKVTTVPEGKQILVKVGADWYTYIRIGEVFYKLGPWVTV